ncbi:integrase family protein [Allomeiothermus silvanus DSM 9946]|uniref:Integrase family protein n=1 Tax=Allomeiothermus silvanus (strain ATCC 700542 / DSM 9946 / NBRC 106475 / NCIMB 13440 / VI-R2) TaxID=526227 RepID=D7BH71_ALLS1|nr:tyrosine-type recombinase/integrase [Allomeiothermus silvanus]ADH63924.1 integrase family protein [Allomeiothermus silvanus DSM 9946]
MLVPLANWQNPSKRRIAAIRAAQERDEAALLELLEAYLILKGRKRASLSPKTLETYRLGVRDFLAWAWPPDAPAPQVQILKATADDLDRYIADLQTEGSHLVGRVLEYRRQPGANGPSLKPSSIATYLAGVRALYKALEWADAATLPMGVRAPRDPTPAYERRPALPVSLYRHLLAHLETGEPHHRRDRIAVRLMAEAGLRISEVVHLQVQDIHLAERLLEVKRGKGSKSRSVPLSKSLVAELQDWLRIRLAHAAAGEGRVLVNLGGRKADGRGMTVRGLREILNRHYRTLGFPARYSGAHLLRHTAGTRFYQVSRDLHATARLLGHSNINTSAIYAKMDLQGLFEVVDKLEV